VYLLYRIIFLYHAYRLATHRIVPTAYRLALQS